jgi:hypothetical protein
MLRVEKPDMYFDNWLYVKLLKPHIIFYNKYSINLELCMNLLSRKYNLWIFIPLENVKINNIPL